MNITFTKEETEAFKNTSEFALKDGDYSVEIRKIKIIKSNLGRNLLLEFFEPFEKVIKTLFVSMERDKFINLKAFLIKLGMNPDIDLNNIETEAQSLIGSEAEISLVTKDAESGKKYQNIYFNKIIQKKQDVQNSNDINF